MKRTFNPEDYAEYEPSIYDLRRVSNTYQKIIENKTQIQIDTMLQKMKLKSSVYDLREIELLIKFNEKVKCTL